MKDFFLRHMQKLDQGYMNLKNIVSGPILVNNCQGFVQVQWNLVLMKCQGTGEICLLY